MLGQFLEDPSQKLELETGLRCLERVRVLVSLQKEEVASHENAAGQIYAQKSIQGSTQLGLSEQTRGVRNCQYQTMRDGGTAAAKE